MNYKLQVWVDEQLMTLRADLPKGLAVFEEFLEGVITDEVNRNIVFEKIQSIKTGLVEEEYCGCNGVIADIKKDVVIIHNATMEDMIERGLVNSIDVPDDQVSCTIDIASFCEIIEDWITSLKQFKEKYKK